MELNAVSWWCIYFQIGVLMVMGLATMAFMFYRRREILRVQKEAKKLGGQWGQALIFQSPDDIPRHFVQYGFKSTWVGTAVVYSWVVAPLVGYILMAIGCYLTYTVGQDLYAPPSVDFWKRAFGDWNGIMAPWCVLFTLVHVVAGVMSKFMSAIRARALLPVARMADATHVVIDEDVSYNPDNTSDPEGRKQGKVWFAAPMLEALNTRYKRALTRQVVHIQVVKRCATAGQTRYEDEETTLSHTEESDVELDTGSISNISQGLPLLKSQRLIEYTCVRYIYDEESDAFLPQGQWEPTPKQLHARVKQGGLSVEAARRALGQCGPNEIKVKVSTVPEVLTAEFCDFTQIFNSIGVWNYMVYSAWNVASIWLSMAIFSGLYRALCIIRPSQQQVAEMAEMKQRCEVLRDGSWVHVEANEIALGDVVKIEDGEGAKLPCDGILVAGSIVVNESMLTGEPMPIAKAPVEDGEKAVVSDKLNKAYAGTLTLESTGPFGGKAAMIATSVGASTTRGQMIRMVLFPSTVSFKYTDQLPIVYAGMVVFTLLIVYIIMTHSNMGSPIVNYMAVAGSIAMCLSPMLPVSIVMGQSVSAARLGDKKGEYNIKCLQPARIPIAGKISTMVFDKTGTITKGTMDFAAVIGVTQAAFAQRVELNSSHPASSENRAKVANPTLVPQRLQHALACCHTVKQLKDGQLVGNQVECAMVRTCGWQRSGQNMVSPSGETLTIVRELEFDHHRMTSGTVARRADGGLEVFIKGSYEKVRQIAKGSSVPADYDRITAACAKDNFYTLGVSFKELPQTTTDGQLANMTRDQLEADVEVCGLLLFRNEMKADSGEAIARLREGGIRSVMCTGDNELTGIAVARKCGIVFTSCLKGDMINSRLVWTDPDLDLHKPVDLDSDPDSQLAVTFTAWRHLLQEDEQLLAAIWPRLVVFGRMKPNDKINVVKFLQNQGLVVGMAGDGGNDCGGLRAAHAGVALSDAEASMVSPFSTGRVGEGAASDDITLQTVPDLIREGRACLATNLATFQYFMVYGLSVTTIRTIVVVLSAQTYGEWVWITMDIMIGVCMVFCMTQSEAAKTLASYRPTGSLLGPKTVLGVAFPYLTSVAALLFGFHRLWGKPWYDHLNPTQDIHILPQEWMKKGDNYDIPVASLVVFTTLSTTAYVSTYGGAFRRNVLRNTGLNVLYAIGLFGVFFMCFTDPSPASCIFRINCDTEASLAGSGIPVLSQFSAGGTGGCFLGPQVKYWQPLVNSSQPWLPKADEHCLPPDSALKVLPLDDPTISTGKGMLLPHCYGPNNCYSTDFKLELGAILAVFILLNHLFAKFVLMGPVADVIRKHRQQQHRGVDESEECSESEVSSECAE